MEYRALTKPERVVLEALEGGLSKNKAYIQGYRASRRWKVETLEIRVRKFFSTDRMKHFVEYGVNNLPKEKPLSERHAGGAPTKYRPEYVEQMIKYFNVSISTEVATDSGVKMVATELPTLAGFCCELEICRDTLNAWLNATNEDGSKLWPEFSVAYRRSKEYQQKILVANTLNGKYNAQFAKFVAQNLLEWRESKDVVISGNAEKPLQIITKEMSAEEAAQIYLESFKN